jgi:hypothetical protein
MKKLTSLYYFLANEIPTLKFDIIPRHDIEGYLGQIIKPNKFGHVVRSADAFTADPNAEPEGFMPWARVLGLDQIGWPAQLEQTIAAAHDVYSQIRPDQVAFTHHQRQFEKGGVLRVD